MTDGLGEENLEIRELEQTGEPICDRIWVERYQNSE